MDTATTSETTAVAAANRVSALAPDLMSLTSLRSHSDDYWGRVMKLCQQTNPLHFGLEFPSWAYANFEYLDSGTYSHVIKALDLENDKTPVVFKIIKVLQRTTMSRLSDLSFKGCELYEDVFQEIVIIKLLSNLHGIVVDSAGYEYCCHSFPRIYRTRLVHGDIPNYFLIRRSEESLAKVKPVERFDDLFGVPREQLVIVMKFGGDSLWDRIQAKAKDQLTPEQLVSVCFQVTFALAVTEAVYEFEHRDMHVCNCLVKPTKKSQIKFRLRSVDYVVQSYGIKAVIIDATFSRMAIGARSYYTDLSSRLKGAAANPNPDGQEVAYKNMYNLVGDRWADWFPETNIFWLRYFYRELLTSDAFTDAAPLEMTLLKQLIDTVANYKKVADFALAIVRQQSAGGGGSGSKTQNSRQRQQEQHLVDRGPGGASMSNL